MARTTSKTTAKASTKNSYRDKVKGIAFYEKYLLTVYEASYYFHLGDRKMYELIHEYEGAKWMVRSGNKTLIKKELFARWLDQQTEI